MLIQRLRKVIRLSIMALLTFTPLTKVCIADEVAPQPYHIEMIIFERLESSFNAPEFWRKDFGLAYPPDYRIIAPVELPLDEQDANQVLTTTENPQDNNDSLEPISKRGYNQDLLKNSRVLPERLSEDYILNEQAKAINGRNKMRVLFHKAWQQALLPTEKSPYVVITGGDVFDNLHELGGTIRFSVNKFIHVDTKLWFTEFTPNYGQASTGPELPTEPNLLFSQQDPAIDFENQLNINGSVDYGISQASLENSPSSNILKSNIYSGSHLQTDDNAYFGNSLSNQKTSAKYLPNEIILLEQSRRMRSRELHYIDHPRLGILIKIVPISFEEAEKLNPLH